LVCIRAFSCFANNTGDVFGSYEVTLKIDDIIVDTKEVVIAGGTSEQVTFTRTMDESGIHSVDVNGLTGTFTVEKGTGSPFELSEAHREVHWWIIGDIILGVVAVSLGIWRVIAFRKPKPLD
jgi:hypothetical protein